MTHGPLAGAKFWLGVLTEIGNRGVGDVLVVCCDGLAGFPDAIEAVWAQAIVQTCVVHLIRNESAWDPRRLHTLEVRMEHGKFKCGSDAEAVSA